MRLLLWDEETEVTAPYLFLSISRSFSGFFFQTSSEWLLWKYPTKLKHVQRVRDNKAVELLQLML